MKEVEATLVIEINVICPNCDSYINLRNEEDTNNIDLDDNNHVLGQAIPCDSSYWSDHQHTFKVEDVTCTDCKFTFNVKGIVW